VAKRGRKERAHRERLPETGYDNAVEFVWGLDLILNGLDRPPRGA
jgi:hypothetical protein